MRSLIFPGLFSTCLLVACGSDSAEKVTFANLEGADREAMAQGSTGSVEASLIIAVALATPTTSCPAITITGTEVSIRGGCTDEDGARWTGSLAADVSLSGNISISADGFGSVATDGTFAVDGEIDLVGTSLSSDTSLTVDDQTLLVDAEWTNADNDTQTVEAGSTVELEGEGYADISGQWNADDETGSLVLTGEDTLRLDFADLNASGCAAATIDGASAGYICAGASFSANAAAPRPLASFQAVARRLLIARQ